MSIPTKDHHTISLINTSLQNLRNILSEADSSAHISNNKITESSRVNFGNPTKGAISKSDLEKIIIGLKSIPRQYVMKEEVAKIFLRLCEENEDNASLYAMERFKELINNKVLL
ncbi:MAG: hypothetical protein JNN05_11660 [Candidatus Omnitrophica bacterium]|nr:hypothetical protein [Candidatus Omnitrophota bacterium]